MSRGAKFEAQDRVVEDITVMVITYNEAANIARTLEAVKWAPRLLIVDSGSTDETLAIVARYPNAEVVTRKFDDFASQCNFGLTHIETKWVLSLDADYELSHDLSQELRSLNTPSFAAYEARFTYCIHGRPLRGTLYPPRRVLYRRDRACYRNEGHGHRVEIDGTIGRLKGKIRHDDRKPLARWLASQQKYASNEAHYLLSVPREKLGTVDKLRRKGWPMPIVAFFYTLVWKGCLFDGWPGWLYVLQRTFAETMIALEIVNRKIIPLKAAGGLGSDTQGPQT